MPISVPTPTKNYDPRENSPIKMPEQEFCVTCGQPLAPKVKPLTNDMSQYLNGDDMKSVVVMNSMDDVKEIKGVNFYRIKGWDHERKPILAVKQVASAPTPTGEKK